MNCEDFIREFSDKVDWDYISSYQTLSEDFIREFSDKVSWDYVSRYQKLSEDFIREFHDRVSWFWISYCQILSKEFILEFSDRVNAVYQMSTNHDNRTVEQKRQEVAEYAKKHDLVFKDDVLYAFRNHDENGCGVFNKTIRYSVGNYYRDWHCDLNPKTQNSFGLGIFPEGNTPVTVKLEDWGVAVEVDETTVGKARVWGFSM